ncbi:MAG TPA: hypothetical protein ENJ28_05020 [Gammaproteobacteria bacterium]|nr:hypothetical protein [Gammaproteobacteria bacterium]
MSNKMSDAYKHTYSVKDKPEKVRGNDGREYWCYKCRNHGFKLKKENKKLEAQLKEKDERLALAEKTIHNALSHLKLFPTYNDHCNTCNILQDYQQATKEDV